MKRVCCVVGVGLFLVSLAGCSRGWPSLFCMNGFQCYEVVQETECGNSEAYYAPSAPTIEYLPAPTRSRSDELPMPGPDRSS